MGPYSPYSINYSEPPKWRPGEEIAAGAFVGTTLYLFVEVNVVISRAFKRRQGLYYWSMQIGSLGILFNTVGIILKHFASPSTNAIWPLYTVFIIFGWGVYATAQSLVLYSRLHLVMRNQRTQRYVLYMIVSTIFIFVVPHLIFCWPAYNTSDHNMSSLWSPREAIVERYTQIGYTITESIISGVYIWSLVPLLRLKSNVRQRRVMTDLIYVNVVVITSDILQVAMRYTNQVGLSLPIQTFSYILKLRLEFFVLNQLMDVAAHGMGRGAFGKNRYFHTANQKNSSSSDNVPSQEAKDSGQTVKKDLSRDPAQTALESSIPLSGSISSLKSTYQVGPTNRSGSDVQILRQGSEQEAYSFDHSSNGKPLTHNVKPGAGFFDKLPWTFHNSNTRSSGPSKDSKDQKLVAFRRGGRSHRGNSGDEEEEEEEEEEIVLQMWERRGTAVVDIPWFRSKVEV